MMEQLAKCPICGSSQLDPFFKVADHFGSKELFNIELCNDCEGLVTNPRPDEKEIVTYYKSNSYVSHGQSKGILFDYVYKRLQQINLKNKYLLIKKEHSGKRLLDYGCGAGSFLEYMYQRNYKVNGVEPDASARGLIDPQIPTATSIDDLPTQQYDVITAFHVIEHVHELHHTLGALKQRLDPNGILVLALPNPLSYDAQYYGTDWAGYDVPRHLYHFNQKSLDSLAYQFNLGVSKVLPMRLDSYYVSLLSEQYKKSKFAPVKALWHGYRSNQLAKTSGEYSSLLYVLKKLED